LWLSSRDVTRLSYVAVGTKKTKGGAGAGVRCVVCNILAHVGVHHTYHFGPFVSFFLGPIGRISFFRKVDLPIQYSIATTSL
jgi:hypothetical protein